MKDDEDRPRKPDRDAVPPPGYRVIYTPYIVRNGVKIYPKNAKVFRFYVPVDK